jgi:hypothetical protein
MARYLHIVLHPPPQHNDGNQEQDFHIPVASWQTLTYKPNLTECLASALHVGPNDIHYIGANVLPQTARFGRLVTPSILLTQNHPEYTVPVVVHNEGGHLEIACIENSSQKWKRTVLYDLNDAVYAHEMKGSPNFETEAICQEVWEYTGPQFHQILGDSGEPTSLCVMMTLQKAVRKDKGQPLSFFGGRRIWALRKLAVFIHPMLVN